MLNFFLFFFMLYNILFLLKNVVFMLYNIFFLDTTFEFSSSIAAPTTATATATTEVGGWCTIFSIKPIYDIMNYVWKFLWNSPSILIRILLASLIIQQFIWLLSSSRIRWPWNFCEILAGFDHNFTRNLNISIRKIDDNGIIVNFSRIWSQFYKKSLSIFPSEK